jgi:hypothetical protein
LSEGHCDTGVAAFVRQLPGDTLRRIAVFFVVAALASGASVSADESQKPQATETPLFERDIHPLLKTYCWKCHGGEGYAGELDFRSLPLILKGGKNGAVLEPGSSATSRLYQKLAAKEMPPGEALKPTDAHLATIKAWIDAGAPAKYTGGPPTDEEAPQPSDDDRNWWAFRKPAPPAVPAVRNAHLVRTPIDAFMLARLEEKGLAFSPEADRLSLLRRASLDLTGLPPAPEEIEAFLADDGPAAWQKLIDRLLESPHYGERWGRHWLDAAGYVDTNGADNDADIINIRENGWHYRDYVVAAFNADKPYDRFLLEQIAGDELVDWRGADKFTPEIRELLTATGFLRPAADDTSAMELNTADVRHRVLYDNLQTFSTNVLGLTIHCAQCHSHKFDPISQADYYRLLAIFAPAYNVQNWKNPTERFLADVSPAEKAEIDNRSGDIDKQVGELNRQLAEIRQPVRQRLFEARLATLPEAIREDTRKALETAADKRSEVQKYLAEKLGAALAVKPEDIAAALDEATRNAVAEREQKVAGLNGSKKSYGKIQAVWDVGPAPAVYLNRRGGYEMPGAAVEPAFPAVLVQDAAEGMQPAVPGAPTSGFRTALAHWLTGSDHPLTARVIVNRVWQQYFGRGIVSTPDNFGRSGALPTHPELLDWLAREFVDSGWRFKTLHRLILNSSVYRQSSHEPAQTSTTAHAPDDGRAVDPDNRLLWRMPLRRLESEIIRDSILAVSGSLDPTLAGPPVPIKPMPDGMVVVESPKQPTAANPFRRSLYLVSRRNYQPTELSVFDQPLVATNCTRRTSAAVALQSLTMLNGEFITAQAEQFARRVIATAGPDDCRRIEVAFQLALTRSPSPDELELTRRLLDRQHERERAFAAPDKTPVQFDERALFHVCHMLLNTNEFLYVP